MALVARIDLRGLKEVENLALEAELAVQILEGEANTPIVEAVKEGLASALEGLRGGPRDASSGD